MIVKIILDLGEIVLIALVFLFLLGLVLGIVGTILKILICIGKAIFQIIRFIWKTKILYFCILLALWYHYLYSGIRKNDIVSALIVIAISLVLLICAKKLYHLILHRIKRTDLYKKIYFKNFIRTIQKAGGHVAFPTEMITEMERLGIQWNRDDE